jgi:hypothetical protein
MIRTCFYGKIFSMSRWARHALQVREINTNREDLRSSEILRSMSGNPLPTFRVNLSGPIFKG